MATFNAFCVVFLLIVCSVGANQQINEREEFIKVTASKGQPVPKPQHYTQSAVNIAINSETFQFIATGQSCDVLQEAFRRYSEMIFPGIKRDTKLLFKPRKLLLPYLNRFSPYSSGFSVGVNVKTACGPDSSGNKQYPALESDESYNITVNATGALLESFTVWGALRGLETFSQLFYKGQDGMLTINKCRIVDFPRFKHRGLLFDTSRHFISMDVLKLNLDAMAQSKFNVFHWHIVDDPSFPYQSKIFPALSDKGSYYGLSHVYTQEEVKELIEYARLRGIRVVPEFDSPGHTQSWGLGVKKLLTECYSKGKFNGNYGPIDPTVNSSYTFLQQFFKEIADVFPDHYVHLGGDEVSFACWESNPEIQAFMKNMSFGTNYAKLEEFYMQKLIEIVNNLKKGYLIWQEVIDNGATVTKDTVVEVWKLGGFQKEMSKVTAMGYQTVLTACWYLNIMSYGSDWISKDTIVEVWKPHLFTWEMFKVTAMGYKTILSACWYLNIISYGNDWINYYQCDPQGFLGTQEQMDLVIGGEVCMWGEYVDNTNAISRTWPRATAVAERLWSNVNVTDVSDAAARISEHRCRMIKRGIPAEPFNGPGFCPEEFNNTIS